MAERARRSVGATLAATRAAWREGVAGNLAGGTHHSYADRGSGFCVFNDVAVAARQAQADHLNDGSGWPLQVADSLEVIRAPDPEELRVLRELHAGRSRGEPR